MSQITDQQNSPSYTSLEKSFKQVVSPKDEFLHQPTTNGKINKICESKPQIKAHSQQYPNYEEVKKTNYNIRT